MSTKTKLTIKDLQREIITLERITNALNTAVVALAYATKVKGDELDGIDSDTYTEYVTGHLHPLVRRADEIVAEAIAKETEQAKKEGEKDGE